MRGASSDPLLWAIGLVAALLLLASLAQRSLWQDEAETALLAKNLLAFGKPLAFDGKNVVSQEAGKEFGPDWLWRWSPWMQYGVAAASIGLLGPTTLAARLPFALLGLFCVPLTYLLARRLFGSVSVARLSATFLGASVPFILHARQARWYALIDLWFVILLLCVSGMTRGGRLSVSGFVLSGAAAFYSNTFVAIAFLAALLLAAPFLDSGRPFLRRLVLAESGVALCAIPGVLLFEPFARESVKGIAEALGQLWYELCLYWTFVLPLPVLALVLCRLLARPGAGQPPEGRRASAFLVVLSLGYLGLIAFAPWTMFRYVGVLLPPASLLIAASSAWLLERGRRAGAAAVLLLVSTNAIHLAPFGYLRTPGTASADGLPSGTLVGSPLLAYLYELTHPLEAPEDAVAVYLNRHARSTDVVLAT